MKKRKIVFLFTLILVLTVSLAHAFVFPQQTRCILIDYYEFENEGQLYYRPGLDEEIKNDIMLKIKEAEKRMVGFWGENLSQPIFIYCQNDEDYKKFGVPFMTPAAAHMKWGAYVIISKSGVNLDIIAHELSHTELYERIGFFNREFKIPTWFDEGLAMQVDHRDYYSIDTLRVKSNNFKELPDVKKMNSYAQFGNGTRKEVMLNYSTAKYEVSKWYTPEKLKNFVDKINSGSSFDDSY